MNKEYVKTVKNVVVLTNNGIKTMENIDNVKKVLQTENNIEEINKLKELVKLGEFSSFIENKKFLIKKNLPKNILPFAGFIFFLSILLTNSFGLYEGLKFSLALLSFLGVFTIFEIALCKSEAKEKFKTSLHKQTKLLDVELNNQHRNLRELVKNAKIDKSFIPSELNKVQKIDRTKLIENLKRKLELINFYELNKDGFVLTAIMEGDFTDSEKEFLKSLMMQEEKERENKKIKIFKK